MSEKIEKGKPTNQSKHIPKDAQVIMSILKDMGIEEYEPRIINQLLEFVYRYVTCILDDAKVYSKNDRKKDIDVDDVRLAIDIMLERIFVSPPSRQTLVELAKLKNHTPLPMIKPHAGLRLPADRYCLSACNYRMKPFTKRTVYQPVKASVQFPNNSKSNKPVNVTVIKQKGANASLTNASGPTTVSVPKPIVKFTSSAPKAPVIKTQIVTATDNFVKNEAMDTSSSDMKRKWPEDN